jgi:hypothetical protein
LTWIKPPAAAGCIIQQGQYRQEGSASMMRRAIVIAALYTLAGALLECSTAAAQQVPAAPAQPKREIIPGSELMTSQERERYRQRMRGARSDEERNRYRAEHTKQMQERARLRGLQLAEPPAGEKK